MTSTSEHGCGDWRRDDGARHGVRARCARGSRPSSGTAHRRRPETSPSVGAEVAQSAADAARRAAIVVTMVPDADAVVATATRRGHAGGSRSRLDLGADEHDRRGGHRARHGARRCRSVPTSRSSTRPSRAARTPAEHGELTIFASGPDDVRAHVTPLLDRARPPDPLGRFGRQRHTREGREQRVVGVWGRAVDVSVALAHRLGLDTQTMVEGTACTGGTTRVCVAVGQAPTRGKGRLLTAVRIAPRAQGRTARPRRSGRRGVRRPHGLADEWQQAVAAGLGGPGPHRRHPDPGATSEYALTHPTVVA